VKNLNLIPGRRSLLCAVLLTVCFSLSEAQSVEEGRISGVTQDSSGAVIANANLSIQNLCTGLSDKITSDSQGLFVSPPLQSAEYDVAVEVSGLLRQYSSPHLEGKGYE
jgi:hypothetical protein